MPLNTTVQFRTDAEVKEAAFAVFREMGISPSTAMQLFLQQVQRTKTLPFIVTANHENMVAEASATYRAKEVKEEGYDDWLRARLTQTIQKLDSGEMPTYTTAQVRANLKARRAEWRAQNAAKTSN